MTSNMIAVRVLEQEARGLLTRLDMTKPFVLQMPSVPAANISPESQIAIERYLADGNHKLRRIMQYYLKWLQSPSGYRASPSEGQRRLTILRLRFNAMLSYFDIFADALTQRSEHDIGVWLSGLDVLATDALKLPGHYYEPPPVICYLDRGLGAAIRRARTRLPGGGKNPVAIIRVPRERMIGSGVASSLIHEVGHQGIALLDLVNSTRIFLREVKDRITSERFAWEFWERWISEVLADFWSVAKLGITSTLGLFAVVSLPRPFVFRVSMDDPHPIPWIRVKLSCAMGNALYPHIQWKRLADLWESFYPKEGLNEEKERIITALESTMPHFVGLLTNYRPESLRGDSLKEAISSERLQPDRLMDYHRMWRYSPSQMIRASPTLVFAVLGQAKVNGEISPEEESQLLADLLRHWALDNTLNISSTYARLPRTQAVALVT